MDFAAGIDLGGTSAKIGLVDASGRLLGRARVDIDARADHHAILAAVIAGVRSLAAARPTGDRLVAVGMGLPGFLDGDGNLVGGCENIPGLMYQPVAAILAAGTGAPSFADNDATCAAEAELAFGAGRQFASFVLATIGTGIGGGIVLDGKVWRGARGFAGEIGHLCLDPAGRPCACGLRGCLEQYASGPAISRAYRELADREGAAPAAPPPAEIAARAAAGDRAAAAAFEAAGRALAQAFGIVLQLLDVEALLLGGGVSAAGPVLLDPVRRSIAEFSYPLLARSVRVVPAALSNDAGLLGAAAQAFRRLGR